MEEEKKESTEPVSSEPVSAAPLKTEENAAPKAEEKKDNKAWSITKKVVDWVFTAFIIIIAAIVVMSVATKGKNYNVPIIFNYQICHVVTDSMAHDETNGDKELYPVGDAVFAKKVEAKNVAVGDNILFYGCYYDSSNGAYQLPTVHHVFYIGTDENKDTYFLCRGLNTADHSDIKEQWQKVYTSETTGFAKLKLDVEASKHDAVDNADDATRTGYYTAAGILMGKITGDSKFVGGFYTMMEQWWAVLLLILVPCLIIAASSIVDIIKLKKTPDEELEKEYGSEPKVNAAPVDPDNPLAGLSEEDKQKLKDEMLKKMLEEQKDSKGGDK
jgi:hypothetical protein